jgi:hypothetical protein
MKFFEGQIETMYSLHAPNIFRNRTATKKAGFLLTQEIPAHKDDTENWFVLYTGADGKPDIGKLVSFEYMTQGPAKGEWVAIVQDHVRPGVSKQAILPVLTTFISYCRWVEM